MAWTIRYSPETGSKKPFELISPSGKVYASFATEAKAKAKADWMNS